MKSRLELENQLAPLLENRNMEKVKDLMRRNFRVDKFVRLTNEQLEYFIELIRDAIYKGLL